MTELDIPITFRTEILSKVISLFRDGESCSLVGVGSSGKSNIARQLKRHETLEYYLGPQAAAGRLYIYINCAKLPDYTTQDVYSLILYELAQKAAELGDTALQNRLEEWWREAVLPGHEAFARPNLERALSTVLSAGARQIILALDDCDALIRNAPPALLRGLRALRDDHKRELVYLLLSRRELWQLVKTETPEFEDFYELVSSHTFAIGPYTKTDALFMLARLASRAEPVAGQLDPERSERLFVLTGGHAGLIKAVFYATHRGQDALDPNLLVKLNGESEVSAECGKIWESLESDEQAELRALALHETPPGRAIEQLKVKGLVRPDVQGRLAIPSPLLKNYVLALAQPARTVRPIEITVLPGAHTVVVDNRTIGPLEPCEYELFQLLNKRRPRPCSTDELFDSIKHLEPGEHRSRVANWRRFEECLHRLRADVNTGAREYIIAVPGVGYRLIGLDGK